MPRPPTTEIKVHDYLIEKADGEGVAYLTSGQIAFKVNRRTSDICEILRRLERLEVITWERGKGGRPGKITLL